MIGILEVTKGYLIVVLMLSIFSCAYGPFVYLLWRNVYSNLCSFLNSVAFLLFTYRNFLCILDTGPLTDTWFANILFHSVCCLFTLMVSSEAQKFVILMKSNLSFFFFWLLVILVLYWRNHCLTQGSMIFLKLQCDQFTSFFKHLQKLLTTFRIIFFKQFIYLFLF